eukprot:15431658-Alexandrium_andersonii.AAC.1
MVKSICYGVEPLAWQGGLLHPVHKGGGASRQECPAHRAVVLEDAGAKLFHKVSRSLAFPQAV